MILKYILFFFITSIDLGGGIPRYYGVLKKEGIDLLSKGLINFTLKALNNFNVERYTMENYDYGLFLNKIKFEDVDVKELKINIKKDKLLLNISEISFNFQAFFSYRMNTFFGFTDTIKMEVSTKKSNMDFVLTSKSNQGGLKVFLVEKCEANFDKFKYRVDSKVSWTYSFLFSLVSEKMKNLFEFGLCGVFQVLLNESPTLLRLQFHNNEIHFSHPFDSPISNQIKITQEFEERGLAETMANKKHLTFVITEEVLDDLGWILLKSKLLDSRQRMAGEDFYVKFGLFEIENIMTKAPKFKISEKGVEIVFYFQSKTSLGITTYYKKQINSVDIELKTLVHFGIDNNLIFGKIKDFKPKFILQNSKASMVFSYVNHYWNEIFKKTFLPLINLQLQKGLNIPQIFDLKLENGNFIYKEGFIVFVSNLSDVIIENLIDN